MRAIYVSYSNCETMCCTLLYSQDPVSHRMQSKPCAKYFLHSVSQDTLTTWLDGQSPHHHTAPTSMWFSRAYWHPRVPGSHVLWAVSLPSTLPKFICWSLITKVIVLESGLWGTIRSWGCSPHKWDYCSSRKRRRYRVSLFALNCVKIQWKMATCKPGGRLSPVSGSVSALVLDFLTFRTLRNKFLLFKPPDPWYVL